MGKKMRHAPVYFAIVQVRFNPIMALDDYAPKIQDRMRRDGYPDLQKVMFPTFNLNISPGEASPVQVPVVQTARYTFANMAKTSGFALDQGSLSFLTADYDVFGTFSATFVAGLKIVHDVVGLDYVDRIGVRYLDAVYPQKDEELSKYLTESVLGLYGKVTGSIGHSFSETLVRVENINVIARTIIQDGQIGFPPDLHPMWLVLSERFRTLSGFHAILDTDGSYEARTAFDLDDVATRLKIVHSAVTTSFKATVTQYAIDSWE
ncbi:MAG: TIGR04255 family protein [Rhodospirillales bacterium]|nr:TIGR04255 family protein [Rhodospirillales bacterium]